jgi:molybdopterin converting factor small subunit
MNRITIEIWLWLGRELGEDFEPLSEMRSKRKETVEEGTTIREVLERLAGRYPPVAPKVFDLREKKLYTDVVVNYNDRVISPFAVYDQVLKEGDKITILPMYMGG